MQTKCLRNRIAVGVAGSAHYIDVDRLFLRLGQGSLMTASLACTCCSLVSLVRYCFLITNAFFGGLNGHHLATSEISNEFNIFQRAIDQIKYKLRSRRIACDLNMFLYQRNISGYSLSNTVAEWAWSYLLFLYGIIFYYGAADFA